MNFGSSATTIVAMGDSADAPHATYRIEQTRAANLATLL